MTGRLETCLSLSWFHFFPQVSIRGTILCLMAEPPETAASSRHSPFSAYRLEGSLVGNCQHLWRGLLPPNSSESTACIKGQRLTGLWL